MKVLFLSNSFPPAIGGAEMVCQNIVNILVSEGHDVTVVTQSHPERIIEVVCPSNPTIVEMEAKSAYSYMPGLSSFLDSNDFDLYISFGYGKYFSDKVMFWCKKHNKRSIFMPCGDFHTAQDDFKKVLYSFILGSGAFVNADSVVVATDWEKMHWIEKYHFEGMSDKFKVIPYNLDNGFIKFKETGILKKYGLKKKQYLLYIGRTWPNKLTDLLLEAYNDTSKHFPLVFAGKGTEKYFIDWRKDIILNMYNKKQLKEIRIKACKLFGTTSIGTVSENDKKTLIKNARACIFPSSYESYGMVILESLALNTPVIGSNIGPFRELLPSRYLFNNNIESLSKCINNLYYEKLEVPKVILLNYKKELLKIVNNTHKQPTEKNAQADENTIIWIALLILFLIAGVLLFSDIFKMLIIAIKQVLM